MTGPRDVDEGYIKFECVFTPGPPPDATLLTELDATRQNLFALGLVGHDEKDDVDYGNISVRGPAPGQIIITGTQTGHLSKLTPEHYALVTRCDIDTNRVECTGTIKASSETLTHAAIYRLSPSIGAIVHVHSRALWERLKNVAPTTRADVAYGTPAMARELARLYIESELPQRCLAVMAGHPAGLISFGKIPQDAEAPLFR
jgi:L-ribulose-5-phosphate 4-epimerase